MRLTWRDALATAFVLVAGALYLRWLDAGEVLGMSSARMVGLTVMLLGLAASVTAVVYGVGAGLLRASKIYLAITSLIGLAAVVAGIWVLVNADETMLAVLVVATGVLWLAATIRHMMTLPLERAERGRPVFGHT
jgi:hypothetical protein